MQFMNECSQTPSYIAQYCDVELKKGLKGASEQEIDSRLSAIVRLFCCLHGRDIFIKSYTKFLASRLLNKTLLSQEAEQEMLQKLKVECGVNTMNKISKMFTDMEMSKELQTAFTKVKGAEIAGIAFSAEVLTNGTWPTDASPNASIPAPMKQCQASYTAFYQNKHNNRKLDWLYHNGQAEVTTPFTDKPF